MRINNFIFSLVTKFVPMPRHELNELQEEAESWFVKNTTKEPKTVTEKTLSFFEKWQVRLGLAIMWIFAVKSIKDYLESSEEEEEDTK